MSSPTQAGPDQKTRCGPGGIRRSKAGPRRAAVLVLVHVAIAAHVAWWLAKGSTFSPLEPSEGMEFFKRGVVNAGFVFFGATILLTALFGRWFCGWGCHLVALQDLCRWMLGKLGLRPRPMRSRLLLAVPALAFVYMFLWPLAYRIWIGDDVGFRSTELTTETFWATFPPWPIALLTFLVAGFAIVWFLGAKGFCTYACPYGAIFGLVEKLAPGRIRVTDACEGCGHCTAVCSSNVLVHAEVRDYGMVVDPGCMKCLDCVSVCPNDALYFGLGRPGTLVPARNDRPARAPRRPIARWKLGRWKDYVISEELLLAALFALAFVAFRGLYGMVPFLFSLAIAGILAYLGVQLARLLYAADVELQRVRVKRAGRLTRSGYAFLATMTPVIAFWGHSGLVSYHDWRARAGWERTAELRAAWFSHPDATVQGDDAALARATLDHARALERIGLVRDEHNALRVAWMDLLLGRRHEFERRLDEIVTADPYDASLLLEKADHHAALRDVAAAFELYRRAIEARPDSALGYERLGAAAGALGELERAADLLAGLEPAHGHEPMLRYARGLLLVELGRGADGTRELRRALEADPGLHAARAALAAALLASGDPALLRESIEHHERLLRARPGDADLHLQIAQACAALGELEAAERHLRALVELEPEAAVGWIFLGQVAGRLGREAEARGHLERAAQLDSRLRRP